MKVLAFTLGFILGVLARPVKLMVTFYYPKTTFAEGLDGRRRSRWEWSTTP